MCLTDVGLLGRADSLRDSLHHPLVLQHTGHRVDRPADRRVPRAQMRMQKLVARRCERTGDTYPHGVPML